jgi:CheY-like chemotaxis protein
MSLCDPLKDLVVDDDPDIVNLLALLLHDSGYLAVPCLSAVQAICLAEELPMAALKVTCSFGLRRPVQLDT